MRKSQPQMQINILNKENQDYYLIRNWKYKALKCKSGIANFANFSWRVT